MVTLVPGGCLVRICYTLSVFLKNLRFLLIYLIFVLIANVFFHFLLKAYFHLNYSKEAVEEILSSASSFKFYSDNPCAAKIYGDPVDAGLKYIKVNLHCDRSNSSTNTLDLRAVKTKTYKGALQLLGNIHGFHTEISDTEVVSLGGYKSNQSGVWQCFIGNSTDTEIKDFNGPLKEQERINCFYNFDDFAMNRYYEQN